MRYSQTKRLVTALEEASGMDILIRGYRPEDSAQTIEVFRDSMNSLRSSKGGMHPDHAVDELVKKPDHELRKLIEWGSLTLVAEVQGTGEIVGMAAITNRWYNHLLKSAVGRTYFVKEKFQRGKSGANIGKMLRGATVQKAQDLGFRKIYGYSTPEAVGFHKKFGATFYPAYNIRYLNNSVVVHYYEIELRKSIWNALRIEPYVYELSTLTGKFFAFFRHSE